MLSSKNGIEPLLLIIAIKLVYAIAIGYLSIALYRMIFKKSAIHDSENSDKLSADDTQPNEKQTAPSVADVSVQQTVTEAKTQENVTNEHHDHDEHEYHHDHDHDEHDEHEHHHHHHDGEECDDPECECHHHHHHHADDVFSSWGKETPKKFSKEALEDMLHKLDSGDYGHILRAKGIVNGEDGWLEFDYVPEEHEVRAGHPDYTGRLCVIGAELKEDGLAELFGV